MRRETRANLIFISVFLLLVIPGAVLLFKKKLDPGSPPMFMPDFVRRRLPYMAAQQSPAQVARYVPELTGQWVTEMNRARAGGSPVLMAGRQPLVSDDHVIQVTATQRHDGSHTTLYLIIWDTARDAAQCSATIRIKGEPHPGRITEATAIEMPAAVKRELMNNGVIQPPNRVTWLTLEVPVSVPTAMPGSLELSFNNAQTISTIHIPATGDLDTN